MLHPRTPASLSKWFVCCLAISIAAIWSSVLFFSLSPPSPSISFLYLSWNGWGRKLVQSASFVHCVSFPHVPLLPEKLNFHPLKIHLLCLDFMELRNRTFHQTVQFKIKLNCTRAQKMWQDKDPSHLKNLFKDLPDCTYWYFHVSFKVKTGQWRADSSWTT